MWRLIYISTFLLFCFWAQAQNNSELILRSRVIGKKVLLRWGSNSADIIKEGQKNGFVLTRTSYKGQINSVEKFTFKMSDPSLWESTNKEVNIIREAYEQLNGDNSELSVVDQLNLQRNVYSLTLFMADISSEAAGLTATGYIDTNIDASTKYVYTISIPSLKNVKPASTTITKSDEYELPVLNEIEGNGKELKANLLWNYEKYLEVYSCYIIEKSEDGGKSYNRVSSGPFLPLVNNEVNDPEFIASYEEELSENGKSYFYRVAGIDFFGQLSSFSKPIEVVSKAPPIAVSASFDRIIFNDSKEFELSWYLREKWEREIKGFYIVRSLDGKKTFQKISDLLAPSQRSFIDVSPNNIAFYKVVTVDVNLNEIESSAAIAQKKDNEPPEAPIWDKGYIDSTGLVYLFWEENQEEDLGGYHVFYANSIDAEYSKLTNSAELEINEYVDSIYIMTLTKDIYYKLMAIDFRGNQSEYSEPLKLTRPDLIPPNPPVFKMCKQEIDRTQINFTSSSSDDAIGSFLQRSTNLSDWETIDSTDKKGETSLFYDTTAICAQAYNYRLYSSDDSGLISYSDTISLSCIDSGKRPLIQDFTLEQQENKIILKWDYDFYTTVKSVLIYREENGDKLRKIEQLWKDEITAENRRSYVDEDVERGTSYSYKVILRFDDNGFTMSNQSEFFQTIKE